jgi:hypothetical protein
VNTHVATVAGKDLNARPHVHSMGSTTFLPIRCDLHAVRQSPVGGRSQPCLPSNRAASTLAEMISAGRVHISAQPHAQCLISHYLGNVACMCSSAVWRPRHRSSHASGNKGPVQPRRAEILSHAVANYSERPCILDDGTVHDSFIKAVMLDHLG